MRNHREISAKKQYRTMAVELAEQLRRSGQSRTAERRRNVFVVILAVGLLLIVPMAGGIWLSVKKLSGWALPLCLLCWGALPLIIWIRQSLLVRRFCPVKEAEKLVELREGEEALRSLPRSEPLLMIPELPEPHIRNLLYHWLCRCGFREPGEPVAAFRLRAGDLPEDPLRRLSPESEVLAIPLGDWLPKDRAFFIYGRNMLRGEVLSPDGQRIREILPEKTGAARKAAGTARETVEATFLRAYPGQSAPRRFETVVRWDLGGRDPLDGVEIYDGGDFWHLVSFGLSDHRREGTVKREPCGCELTLKLKKDCCPDEDAELRNLWKLLQQIALLPVWEGKRFHPTECLCLDRDDALDARRQSGFTGLLLIRDPAAELTEGSRGRVEFLEIVGLRTTERDTVTDRASAAALYELLGSDLTDYRRASVVPSRDEPRTNRAAADPARKRSLYFYREKSPDDEAPEEGPRSYIQDRSTLDVYFDGQGVRLGGELMGSEFVSETEGAVWLWPPARAGRPLTEEEQRRAAELLTARYRGRSFNVRFEK